MTRRYLTGIGLFLALSWTAAGACAPGDAGCSVDRTDWLSYVKERLPPALCSETSPFVQCALAGQSPCQERASIALSACIAANEARIPVLMNRAESGDWGGALSDCVGREMVSGMDLTSQVCRAFREPSVTANVADPLDQLAQIIARSPRLTRLDKEMRGLQVDLEVKNMIKSIDERDATTGLEMLHSWELAVARQCDQPQCVEKAYRKRIRDLKAQLK